MTPLRRLALRRALGAALLTSLGPLGAGCGNRNLADPARGESPEQTATRVFDVAQKLEAEGKTRQAFAAYHQLSRQFPDTAEGKKAAERIRKAQQPGMSPHRR